MLLGGRHLDLARPQLVGVLNLTPDSFSDGGELPTVDAAIRRAHQLLAAGADLLDIGGESTRPGAQPLDIHDEIARVVPVVAAVARHVQVPLCIDTRRSEVARLALAAGAVAVNDTSGQVLPAMAQAVREFGAAWVLMHAPHALGAMDWSQAAADFPAQIEAGVDRVGQDLAAMVAQALQFGVDRLQLAIDPGIGFGKTAAQNFALLRCPPALHTIGLPVYLGPSRKSFLVSMLPAISAPAPRDRLGATAAAVTVAILHGAAFVRVHDVAAMRQVVDIAVILRDMAASEKTTLSTAMGTSGRHGSRE
ncbi:MAG: dihydropteroate synthase [Myxococcales bacterium]|nr:dihydropteroate synthase [Myxococcales bacterium]